jgi:hypothetical protein
MKYNTSINHGWRMSDALTIAESTVLDHAKNNDTYVKKLLVKCGACSISAENNNAKIEAYRYNSAYKVKKDDLINLLNGYGEKFGKVKEFMIKDEHDNTAYFGVNDDDSNLSLEAKINLLLKPTKQFKSALDYLSKLSSDYSYPCCLTDAVFEAKKGAVIKKSSINFLCKYENDAELLIRFTKYKLELCYLALNTFNLIMFPEWIIYSLFTFGISLLPSDKYVVSSTVPNNNEALNASVKLVNDFLHTETKEEFSIKSNLRKKEN